MIPLITGSAQAVTDRDRDIGHLASLLVVGTMLSGLTAYTAYTAKRRNKKAKGSVWQKWGPTILVGLAMPFILADTTRHVLQDNGLWAEAHVRGFWGNGGSNQYECAASTSGCCPSSYDIFGNEAYHSFGNKTAGKVDIPWSLACDAAIGADKVKDFLKAPCEKIESRTFNGSALGCTVPNATSNLDALLKIPTINASYLFGVKNDSKDPPISMFTFQKGKGYFNDHLTNGCHSHEAMKCLGGTGLIFTIIFTYFGFILLMVGSLWNANLLQKLSKAKQDWDKMRGNAPTSRALLTSRSSGSGTVTDISSDSAFASLISSGAPVMVKFTGSWCKPCKEIAPAFARLASQHAGAQFVTVDVEKCDVSAQKYDVASMPTFIYFKNGADEKRYSGAVDAQLSDFVGSAISGGAYTAPTPELEEVCTT